MGAGTNPLPSRRTGFATRTADRGMVDVVDHAVGEHLLVQELDGELHPGRGHAVGVEGGLPGRRAGRDQRFHAGAEVLVVAHLLGAVRERASCADRRGRPPASCALQAPGSTQATAMAASRVA